MLDCVVYVSSVANVKKHSRKQKCLESFAQGVINFGHQVKIEYDYVYSPNRLAVILGWATTNIGGHNIALRKQVIAEQQRRGMHVMCIDASCWKYIDTDSRYLRYSIGGPFYDHAEYANSNSNNQRWQIISKDLGVALKPHQKKIGRAHV